MPDHSFSSIAAILSQEPLQQHSDPLVEVLLTDSRKLLLAEKTMFFAISSEHRDAHAFIEPLYEQGVRNFVVENSFSKERAMLFAEGNFIAVPDVVDALQQLAASHRKQFTYPVIGISGSNGKTIVKEWLNQLLAEEFHVLRSPKSYNSQVGVPLSVWQMSDRYNLALFEAGISQPGEMIRLQQIIQPTIGIFTNIGEAHNAGFSDMREKVGEKMQLFTHCRKVIYNQDEELIAEAFQSLKNSGQPLELFSWGWQESATLVITGEHKTRKDTLITARYCGREISITIPFTDKASIENIMHCWCILLALKVGDSKISENMLKLKPIEMRLQLKHGINNCSIINDSYSADVTSLSMALDFLKQQQQHPHRTLILSDILQSGRDPESLYAEVAGIIREKKVNKLIGVGPEISRHSHLFSDMAVHFFPSTDQLLAQLPALNFSNETILLKGARYFEFEKISYALEEKTHESVLEIHLSALRDNLKYYRSFLKPGVQMMAMVKAFSYGSGSFEIANVLQHAGIHYLAVAYADEGVQLRKAGIRLPIMVMNTEAAGFENLLKYDLEPELYSFSIAEKFIEYLGIQKRTAFPVHIKLDTGMHRLGFEQGDIEKLCSLIQASEELVIRSVFSHLASSDDAAHDEFTKQQAYQFSQMAGEIETSVGYTFIKHLANSSAIHRHPGLQFDMVRLGIGLYGVDGRPEVQKHLRSVSTLRTTISQIKQIHAGESVGYSRKAIVDHPVKIATVRVGYADGYPRTLSNGNGYMLVNNRRAPVIGNVCMDMTMLDITGIDAEEGDSVIVFGEGLPVSELAVRANTIAYEILTGISQRVKRIYFED